MVWVSMILAAFYFQRMCGMCPGHVTESDLFGIWHICKTMRNSMFYLKTQKQYSNEEKKINVSRMVANKTLQSKIY